MRRSALNAREAPLFIMTLTKSVLPPPPEACRTVFKTDWFQIVEEQWSLPPSFTQQPYYSLVRNDGVIVLAVTAARQILLVRQYRPCLRRVTIELPCGMVEPGENPIEAAVRELHEETGYACARWEPLGTGNVMPSRVRATEHLFLGFDASPISRPESEAIETVLVSPSELKQMTLSSGFDQLSTLSAILLAEWKLGWLLAEPQEPAHPS